MEQIEVQCDNCGKEEGFAEPQEAPEGWYYATIAIHQEDTPDEKGEDAEEEVEDVRIFACCKKCRDEIWDREPVKGKKS